MTLNLSLISSMSKVVRVAKPQDFDSVVGDLAEKVDQLYVVMIGSEDPQTGESWCEDCVIGTLG